MPIVQVRSTNPDLSFMIKKNPKSVLSLMTSVVRV
ncbi:hypothetical protein [Paenibacillus sp. OSY-SE]